MPWVFLILPIFHYSLVRDIKPPNHQLGIYVLILFTIIIYFLGLGFIVSNPYDFKELGTKNCFEAKDDRFKPIHANSCQLGIYVILFTKYNIFVFFQILVLLLQILLIIVLRQKTMA